MTGIVKWFDDKKGFGFIIAEGVSGDVFAHKNEIDMTGHRTLKQGQRVRFEISQDKKGIRAKNIVPFPPSSEPQLRHLHD